MQKIIGVLTLGVFVLTLAHATPSAQAGKTISQGVYTADQAKRGEPLYKEQCAACHGDDLTGSGPMPPLAGADFFKNWQDKSLGELFEKTHGSMPANAPGSLTEQQTADILAFMLQVSKYPTGSEELAAKAESLMAIKIDTK